MNPWRYFFLMAFWTWAAPGVVLGVVPAVLGVGLSLISLHDMMLSGHLICWSYAIINFGLLALFVWYIRCLRWDARAGLIPDDWLTRYSPLFVPIFYHLVLGTAMELISGYMSDNTSAIVSGDAAIFLVFLAGPQFIVAVFLAAFISPVSGAGFNLALALVVIDLLIAGLGAEFLKRYALHPPQNAKRGIRILAGTTAGAVMLALCVYGVFNHHVRKHHLGEREWGMVVVEEDNFFRGVDGDLCFWDRFGKYYVDGTPLLQPESPSLTITENHPKISGLAAFFPLYAGAACGFYDKTTGPVTDDAGRSYNVCLFWGDHGPNALKGLLADGPDMIFTLRPTEAEMQEAAAAGKPLTVTPVAKEALVFFVHAKNPVNDLTRDQLCEIYSGKTRLWKDVGGQSRQEIRAFQRPWWPGSQVVMRRMMGDVPLMPPITETYTPKGIDYVMHGEAAFRAYRNALGYSFRYYALHPSVDASRVKLLAVEGVAPTAEHIRDGTYPLAEEVVIITAGSENPHVAEIVAWFLSDEGQDYVEKAGFLRL